MFRNVFQFLARQYINFSFISYPSCSSSGLGLQLPDGAKHGDRNTVGNEARFIFDCTFYQDRRLGAQVLCLVAQSGLTLCSHMDCSPLGSSAHGDSPGKIPGVGCHALLQGILPTQGLNPGLLHCRCILYQLSHQGSPRILEWVAYPFSWGSSQPRDQIRVSCIADGFFTS